MADIDRQKFTRAVIEETMRLYPPAFLIARAAREKDNAAGVAIGKGDIIMIAPWLLHRHEKLWDQPNAFIPKRFMSTEAPDRFAYLPFGAGPRVCIGAPFAQAESVAGAGPADRRVPCRACRYQPCHPARRRHDPAGPFTPVPHHASVTGIRLADGVIHTR